ncbi:hypothetical protein EPIR_1952 [Erwinia piriflorinigrans CFBP 5888]|uniref:Uncharacterized protein n=1 Tax=Erwinia piriflorinigrans CFBP 5888 TaxID=1161919 RepID=V5Z7K1_9GAMM|nr:hypothetical protein EPIR_1952 [Erwinia piriflorinigrans CFBP 5888]
MSVGLLPPAFIGDNMTSALKSQINLSLLVPDDYSYCTNEITDTNAL